jgi:hypothetical protein
MKTTRIRYQLGDINGPGGYVGLLCDTQTDFDKASGEWVLTGDEATGRGETHVIASLMWIVDRLKVQLPNGVTAPKRYLRRKHTRVT